MADSPGSKRSMQGYILTYSRIKRNNSNIIYVKTLHKKKKKNHRKLRRVSRGGLTSVAQQSVQETRNRRRSADDSTPQCGTGLGDCIQNFPVTTLTHGGCTILPGWLAKGSSSDAIG